MNSLKTTGCWTAALAGMIFFIGAPTAVDAFEACQEIQANHIDRKKVPGFDNLGVEYLSAHQATKNLFLVVGKKRTEQDILRVIFVEVVTGEPYPMLEKSVEGQCYAPQLFQCPDSSAVVSLGLVGCDVPRQVHVLLKRGENAYKEAGLIDLPLGEGMEINSEKSSLSTAVSQAKRNFKFDLIQTLQPAEGEALTQKVSYTFSGGELKKN